MTEVKSYNDLLSIISEAKVCGRCRYTNFFPNRVLHDDWIDKKTLFYRKQGDVLFLVHKKSVFTELFYQTGSMIELTEVLPEMTSLISGPIIVELISKNHNSNEALGNYPLYNVLRRMTRIGKPILRCICSDIVFADESDKDELQCIFNSEFDLMAERVPEESELKKMLLSKSIILCKKDNRIVGFAAYDLNSLSIHLRYWWVDESYRGQGIGGDLLAFFFRVGKDTRRQYLWVFEDNENAIKRYIHYGFEFDGMSDHIFILNKTIE